MKQVAFFTGSFDPITLGHLQIIERAARIFDQVIVGIFDNPNKTYWWTSEERTDLVKLSCQKITNVQVKNFSRKLVLEAAKEVGATFIIKGLRNSIDYEYEKVAFQFHFEQENLETIYLMTSKEYSHISSSFIREIAQFGGKYQEYVPECVAEAITKKVKG